MNVLFLFYHIKNEFMKLQRKLKKRIIKTFGRGTYVGIINGYLTLKRYHNNRGVETIYTDKPMGDKFGKTWFHAHQYNPYLIFPTIKNSKQK
jgi:hypothetical protein